MVGVFVAGRVLETTVLGGILAAGGVVSLGVTGSEGAAILGLGTGDDVAGVGGGPKLGTGGDDDFLKYWEGNGSCPYLHC
jgi:hypothetical protein